MPLNSALFSTNEPARPRGEMPRPRAGAPAGQTHSVAKAVPSLRQYIRLLWDDDDASVPIAGALGAVVEAASADEAAGRNPRLALFRTLHRLMSGTDAPGTLPPTRLPRARQAVLLADLFGFHPTEVGQIFDINGDEAAWLIEEGRDALLHPRRARIIIVEDEPWIAADLEMIATDMGLDVTGIAATRDAALKLAHETRPDLVLADVRLAGGGNNVEGALDLKETAQAPVIYVTAMADRLSAIANLDGAIVLPKPYRVTTIKTAIGHALAP